MSAEKKIRGDAKLKNLPRERQEQIATMARSTTLVLAVAELAKDGIETSRQALSQFLSFYSLREKFEAVGRFSDSMVELVKQDRPDLSDEALADFGNRFFKVGTIEMANADPEAAALIWAQMEKLRLKAAEVDLARQRFQRETAELFIKWAADQRAQEIANAGGLAQSEKIKRLRELMFSDVPTGDSPTRPQERPKN